MIAPYKQILTIEEILGLYYYKEWIIDELKGIGERTTGNKDELIQRYLDSDIIRTEDVKTIATNLLSTLRKQDLKQILRDHSLKNGKRRDEILDIVLNNFLFEPYVRRTESYCDICHKETNQELHFDNFWKPSYRKCSVCDYYEPLKLAKLEPFDNLGISSQDSSTDNNSSRVKQELQVHEEQGKPFEDNVSDIEIYLKNNYWQSISTIIIVLISFGLKYGLITGLVVSISTTLVVIFAGFLLSTHKRVDR